MTSAPASALKQAEAALLVALDVIRAARDVDPASTPSRHLPIKQAAHELGLSEKTVRRRCQAGAGVLANGRWLVDIDAAAEMSRQRNGEDRQ